MAFNITTDQKGPVLIMVCEQCGEPIMDLEKGIVLWADAESVDSEGHEISDGEQHAIILHKGECCRRFEAPHRAVGNFLQSWELAQMIEAWMQGSQFHSYDRTQARSRLEILRGLDDLANTK